MVKDMIKAVSTVLLTAFPTIENDAESVKEGFSRPSFFVKFDNVSTESPDPLTVEYSATARITYFPESRDINAVELAEMLGDLSEAFRNNLQITPEIIADIQEFSGMSTDGVLNCSFDIRFTAQLPDPDESDLMEALNYETKVR